MYFLRYSALLQRFDKSSLEIHFCTFNGTFNFIYMLVDKHYKLKVNQAGATSFTTYNKIYKH